MRNLIILLALAAAAYIAESHSLTGCTTDAECMAQCERAGGKNCADLFDDEPQS